jgi:8-oxo-dGTP pyrophosphatase MutT (NUDIX family)
VVGAVIPDKNGRIYVHRRTPDRTLLPGAWDIPGGHVEPGETFRRALTREIQEETGWRLNRVVADLGTCDWTDAGRHIQEVDYIVTVTGDHGAPRLEAGLHDASAWITANDLEMLRTSRLKGDQLLHRILERAFEWLAEHGPPAR